MGYRDAMLGVTFHRWTVIALAQKDYVICRCSCGTEKEVYAYNVKSGKTKSCGCWNQERSRKRGTHRLTGGRLWRIWQAMKARCYRKTSPDYRLYGARGIEVCPRWRGSVENFLADMGQPPHGMTLDRKDNNGNYEPSNCRWATPLEQNRNRRDNRLITFRGETLCVSAWEERLGFNKDTLRRRLKLGWEVAEAFTTPTDTKYRHVSA